MKETVSELADKFVNYASEKGISEDQAFAIFSALDNQDGEVTFEDFKSAIDKQAKKQESSPKKKTNLKEGYDEYVFEGVIPLVEEIFEDHKDILHKYEFYNNDGEVESTDGKSYDGFWSFTDGTVNFMGATSLDFMRSTGYTPSNKKLEKVVERVTTELVEDARNEFFNKNKKELEALGFSDYSEIYYQDLEDKDAYDLAEELDEYQRNYLDGAIWFRVACYFKQKKEDVYNCFVYSELILDEYGRPGSGITAFEDEFDFEANEIESALVQIDKLVEKAFGALG